MKKVFVLSPSFKQRHTASSWVFKPNLDIDASKACKMCLLAYICTFHTLYSLQWGRGCKIKYCNLSLPLFFCFFSAVESSADCAIHSTPSPTAVQPCASDVDGLGEGLDQRANATEEELFENVKEVCLQPQTGSQHNKVTLFVNLTNGILSSIEKAIIYVVFMLCHLNL